MYVNENDNEVKYGNDANVTYFMPVIVIAVRIDEKLYEIAKKNAPQF